MNKSICIPVLMALAFFGAETALAEAENNAALWFPATPPRSPAKRLPIED